MTALHLDTHQIESFQNYIKRWQSRHGRHELPWRLDFDPYKILVSETMLQQTQVERVIPKFNLFIQRFENTEKLSQASVAEIVSHWQGLGYNRRGLNLLKAAQYVVEHHNGQIPNTFEELVQLPGVGPYTASAVLTFAYNQPTVVIETNIRTVYIYHFFPQADTIHDNDLRPLIEATMDIRNPREWYSALMDYGTYLKKVIPNPSRKSKHFAQQSTFKGSLRQVRGQILKALTIKDQMSETELLATISGDITKLPEALQQLEKEGFIYVKHKNYQLKD